MNALLNCLSSYSLLQSPNRIDDLVALAAKQGYEAVALTDIDHLYGFVEFDQSCRKHHIKPIFGLTLTHLENQQPYQLILLAQNQQGYNNLLQLSSLVSLHGAQSLTAYEQYFDHLFVLHPLEKGQLWQALQTEQFDVAKKIVQQGRAWQQYLVMSTYLPEQLQKRALMFSEMEDLALVASNQVQYLTVEDAFDCHVLHAIANEQKVTQYDQVETQHYLLNAANWQAKYTDDLHQAVQNMQWIAQNCQVQMTYHHHLLPQFPVPHHLTTNQFLEEQCLAGRAKVEHWDEKYEQRLASELAIIAQMGFADYFLIVWDVMKKARELNILTAPGRGSAAGSLVAYLLNITDVDPLKYGLLFERFLNPSRQTMPDIDLDFPDVKRDLMYDYLQEKYGSDYVARIITFGTLAAKQVIRDVTKVFGLSKIEQDEFARAVYVKEHDVKVTLEHAYRDSYQLRQIVNRNELNQRIFQIALKLEGLPRNTGMHAAGIVLASEKLVDYVPIQQGDELHVTQWPMNDVERVGLLKMDFLSLRNLTIIEETLTSIKYQTGKEIKIQEIDYQDAAVCDAFAKGQTTGIFQFESQGMRNLLKQMQVRNLEDLALVNALHRPGASFNLQELLDRRFSKKPIIYFDPALAHILQETYGIMIYQEQVMQVAVQFAGFSLAEADNLRRAMSKKNQAAMAEVQEPFIQKAMAKGHSQKQAAYVFEQIAMFAGYGFNKSHAIAYSMLAYQMMYLKIHYPLSFYMALFRSTTTQSKTFLEYVQSLKEQGLQLLGPDINRSQVNFIIDNDNIRMGLSSIRGLDKNFLYDLLAERKEHGPYRDIKDLLQRLPKESRKTRYLEALIEAGALDCFAEYNRAELKLNLDGWLSDVTFNNSGLFSSDLQHQAKHTTEDFLAKLEAEKERLGLYISSEPTAQYQELMQELNLQKLTAPIATKQAIRTIIFVKKTFNKYTKKHQRMQKVILDTGNFEVTGTIFPDTLVKYGEMQENMIYIIEGKYQLDNYGEQIIINYFVKAQELSDKLKGEKIYIKVPQLSVFQQKINFLLRKPVREKDVKPLIVVDASTRQRYLLNEHFWVSQEGEKITQIRQVLGKKNVAIQ